MKMTMMFIDGLGIGKNNRSNPFIKANIPTWHQLVESYGYYQADASLGVEGLPQSATGQTSIYTGENAPRVIGRHYSARPTESLVQMIKKNNVFTILKERGYRVTFANVYTREYLDKMNSNPRGVFKPSVTTLLNLSASVSFRLVEDYRKGYGLFHDITGETLRERGYDVPLITPENAADNLFRLSRDFDFTLFEFFVSDLAGHSQDMDRAVAVLERIDRFVGSLIQKMDMEKEIFVIVSDHGNIEDLSTATHTMNPVPVFFITQMEMAKEIEITSITDILPAVLKFFPSTYFH